jgi:hypothetical protein
VVGFLTAENIWDPEARGDVVGDGGTGPALDFLPWIYSWCRQHPTGKATNAVMDLTKTLKGRGEWSRMNRRKLAL